MTKITDHSIKVNRALRLANIGDCPDSASAMLRAIPATAITALTAAQLAEMLDAMWQLAGASKAIADREAISEGGVWDAQREAFRLLA